METERKLFCSVPRSQSVNPQREVVDETSSAGEGAITASADRQRCGEKARMLSAWKSVAPHVETHRPDMVIRGLGAEEWIDSEFGEHCTTGDIVTSSHIASSGEVLSNNPRLRRRRAGERATQQRSPHQSSVEHPFPPQTATAAAAAAANRDEQRGSSATNSSPASNSLASRASPPVLDSSSSITASGPEDEFDAFGRSAAAQLRRMPLRMALRAQLQIQSFLTEARLYACSGYEDFPEDS